MRLILPLTGNFFVERILQLCDLNKQSLLKFCTKSRIKADESATTQLFCAKCQQQRLYVFLRILYILEELNRCIKKDLIIVIIEYLNGSYFYHSILELSPQNTQYQREDDSQDWVSILRRCQSLCFITWLNLCCSLWRVQVARRRRYDKLKLILYDYCYVCNRTYRVTRHKKCDVQSDETISG